MKYIIATKDYAGLGFAVRLLDEGHNCILATNPEPKDVEDPARKAAFDLCGTGMVEKYTLQDLMERREGFRDYYWIWDFNHSVQENEVLRSEGFKAFGGGQYCDDMEHNRQDCLELLSTYGLEAPPSHPFTNTDDAIKFCTEHPETAYVYKPDEGDNFETFLPESEDPVDANQELRMHLQSDSHEGSFILQERIDGVETNVEVWFENGEPIFAWMQLECKRKYVMDLGELTGCALDIAFVIPLDCKAVQLTVGKLYPAYKKRKYTGFGDANFIAAKDGVWFLEKCERFGYNSHANLFFNLSLKGFGQVMSDLVDGSFRPDFAGGFGTSVTMSTKENAPGGKVIQFPQKLWKDIFFWDAYKSGDLYLTAGYDKTGSILIVTGYGYTIPTAWENVMRKAKAIRFPYRHFRPDGDQTNFPSSPIRRYEALKAMGYI